MVSEKTCPYCGGPAKPYERDVEEPYAHIMQAVNELLDNSPDPATDAFELSARILEATPAGA